MKKLYEKIIRREINQTDRHLHKIKLHNKNGKKCFRRRSMEKYFNFLVDALIHCVGEKRFYDEMYGEEKLDY